MIYSDNVGFRRPTNDDDVLVFRCLKDWIDDQGPMSQGRAQKLLAGYLGENEYAHYPVDARSSFRETWIITAGGVDVGIVHMFVKQGEMTVEMLSIAPAHRGSGHFNHAYRLLAASCFELYQCEALEYEAYTDVGAMTAIRERHADGEGAETVSTRTSKRLRDLIRRRITRTMWETRKERLMGVIPWTIDFDAVNAAQALYLDREGKMRSHVYGQPRLEDVSTTMEFRFSIAKPPNPINPLEVPPEE